LSSPSSSGGNATSFSQPQNSEDNISYANLSHEQLKQLHLTFLQPSPPVAPVRMQVPRRNSNNDNNLQQQASSQQNSSPTRSPTQPAMTSMGAILEGGDYPLDFSPIPIQYAALNNNPVFLSGNGVQQQRQPQQQAYPLQYRVISNPEQKMAQQYLLHNGGMVSDRQMPIQLVVQQQPQQQAQPQSQAQQRQSKRKGGAQSTQPEQDSQESHQPDAKRPKRGQSNDENRLVKNRQAAQLFRQRQKQHIKDLEDKVSAVNQVNVSLSAKVDVLKAENKLVKDQLQYLRGFVAVALQHAFPQSKEDLQKRWDAFQKAETERAEKEAAEQKEADRLDAEKNEKRKQDIITTYTDDDL